MYIYLVFVLSIFSRRKITFEHKEIKTKLLQEKVINLKVLHIFGFIGLMFYIYLMIKYFNILNISDIKNIYVQRSLFTNIVSWWEGYIIAFSKFVSALSFLIIAISLRKSYYLYFTIYIYLIDYALAAHKASLFMAMFAILYYNILSKLNIKKYYYVVILIVVFIFSLFLHLSIYNSSFFGNVIISLYDRVFFVTSGLFGRFYDFSNYNYFFGGGSGILGKIFSGVNEPYTLIIGEFYFSKDVMANADLISDGYVNFGLFGSFCQLLFLWIFFNKSDNKILETNFNLILPLILIYSLVLFSVGLQTALLTGGMIFFLGLIKYGFKNKELNEK